VKTAGAGKVSCVAPLHRELAISIWEIGLNVKHERTQ
jgi:hypothetical protein